MTYHEGVVTCDHCGGEIPQIPFRHTWITGSVMEGGAPRHYHLEREFPECRAAGGVGRMPGETRNVRFDEELHDLFSRELANSRFIVETLRDMFAKCYANASSGIPARVSRGMASVLRDLENVRLAAVELRQAEGARPDRAGN